MRLVILFFLMLSSITVDSLYAGGILVWTFKHSAPDTLTDPEIGPAPSSYNYWLKQSLEHNGYSFTVHNDSILPDDISSFDILICAFGYRNC